MKDKHADLKTRRDSLVARQKSAEAQSKVQGAFSAINVLDPTSEISRFEDKVRREEAKAAGQAEVAASSLDAQFEELEVSSAAVEVEARLAALENPAADGPTATHQPARHVRQAADAMASAPQRPISATRSSTGPPSQLLKALRTANATTATRTAMRPLRAVQARTPSPPQPVTAPTTTRHENHHHVTTRQKLRAHDTAPSRRVRRSGAARARRSRLGGLGAVDIRLQEHGKPQILSRRKLELDTPRTGDHW